MNTAVAAWAEVVQAVFDIPLPLWGSLSVSPRGSVPVSLPLGASFPFLVTPTLFLLSRRAPLLGQEGFFTVDILLCFGEHLGHACLRVL